MDVPDRNNNSSDDYDEEDGSGISDYLSDSNSFKSHAVQWPDEETLKHMNKCVAICIRLNEERKENVLCDSTIVVEGKKYPVHKNILAASSSYFSVMFTGSSSEKNEDEIEIKGITAEVFEFILDYLYGENVKLTPNNVKDIIIAGDKLCVDNLITECKMFIKDYWHFMNDVPTVYELAGKFQMNETAEAILHKARHDLVNFRRTEKEFRELPLDFIIKIIENRSFVSDIFDESKMANAVMKWATYKPEERMPESASKIFSVIHFEFLSEEELTTLIKLIRMEENTVKCSLKNILYDMYQKSHQKMINQNFMLVIPESIPSQNIHIFNCELWKWEVLTCSIPLTPEKYILSDNDLYIFDMKGCTKLNLQSKETVALPDFPETRKHSVCSVVDKSVYVMGGHGETTNEPTGDILDLKPNKKSWHRSVWNGMWKNAKFNVSSIPHNQNIFLVGWRNYTSKYNHQSKCFVYSCANRKLKEVCHLSKHLSQPFLAIYDEVLYVITSEYLYTKFEKIDLKTMEQLPETKLDSLCHYYPVLSVCCVDDGIVIAYLHANKILLMLYRPAGLPETETLGVVPIPSSWPKEKPFVNFKLLFYKTENSAEQ